MNNPSNSFSPADPFWRVNRELLINLAGGRALLLELAHPLVAAGVAQHSGFRGHPLRRLWRTMRVMTQLTFGNEAERSRALRAFHGCHQHVHGRLTKAEGQFEPGRFYHAAQPELKLWVLATLIDSALLAYEIFVAKLSPAEKHSYYEDCKSVAQMLDIPAHFIPPSFEDFRAYMEGMLDSEVLCVGTSAREIVAAMMRSWWLYPIVCVARFFGNGLLPKQVRAMYHLRWLEKDEERLQRCAARLRRLRAHLPSCVCVTPKAWLIEKRAMEVDE